MMQAGWCWCLVLVTSVGAYRAIEFKNCKHSSGNPSCKVKNVEVNGCYSPSSWVDSEGTNVEYESVIAKNPCRIDQGSTLNFSITFEPGFSVGSLRSQFSLPELPECWRANAALCPVFSGPEQGCQFTKCPLARGRQQRYETTVAVSPYLLSRPANDRKVHQMRWKLWNNKNKKNNCCFNIPVQY